MTEQPPVVGWDGERASDDDDNAYGDLDINASVIIRGASSSTTIIDGGNASDSSSRGCTTVMALRAFHVYSGNVTFKNLEITGGGSDAWTDQYGGGIYADRVTSLTLDNVVMTENHNRTGSALCSSADSTTILNSDISGNLDSQYGGAIRVSGDSLEVENSTVSHNSTIYGTDDDEGLVVSGSTVTVQASTFSNNGYGIYVDDADITTIINSTISSNSSRGVVINTSGDVNVYSSTIAQNGTGVVVNEGDVTFVSTIIANNNTADCDLSGSFSSTTTQGSYNLITDLSSCGNSSDFTDTVETDPMLSDLADNGGDTETMALGSGSPAIDAGYCDSSVVGTTDQRGYDREEDGDSDGTETCDIGAYEEQVYPKLYLSRPLH